MSISLLRFQRAILIVLLTALCFLVIFQIQQVSSHPTLAAEPETMRVLVVANRNSPVSLRVAQYYMQRRKIPQTNFLELSLPDSSFPLESISYSTYQNQIERPLQEFLRQRNLVNDIRYIVLTKGIPLRVRQVPHLRPGRATLLQDQSVDSTIAAIDYKIPAIEFKDSEEPSAPEKGIFGLMTPNLYWRQTIPFEHHLTGGYMVTRLDGYSEADARALVDRALMPRPRLAGSVLVDQAGENDINGEGNLIDIFDPKACTPTVIPHCVPLPRAMTEAYGSNWYSDINNDFDLSVKLLKRSYPQLNTVLAPPHTFMTGQNLIAYVSWGSNDESFQADKYHKLTFLPGAITETIVSTSARTFFPTWLGQSLIGDLISGNQGVTGARGYVDEPENRGIGSPTVLLSNYFQGANLATSYYRSIRFIGWRDLVLGDPLATAVFKPQ